MGQFSVGVVIDRPPNQVFDFLSDPANLSNWNSSFDSAQWTSNDPPGAGSTYRVVGKILGSRKEGLFQIVAWDRPHRFSYRGLQRVGPIERLESVFTIDPEGGDTRVTLDGQFELVRGLRFAESVFGTLAEKQDGDNLMSAKRVLEGGKVGPVSGFEMSVVIDRPVDEVFAVLADLDNDPTWRREWVDATKTSEGPPGVGARVRLGGQLLRWRIEAEYEITEYEPNRMAAWKTVRGPLPLTFWRKVEAAEGGTRVTIGYDANLRGPGRLAMSLVKPMGRRALAGDFPTLKELMETRAL